MKEDKLAPLVWHTESRVIDALIPYKKNPRQMTKKQAADLQKSLEELNVIDIPAIDTDETIVGGHQRCRILQLLGRGKETTDVRVPNRKLTEREFRSANLRLNRNLAEWDFDMLADMGDDGLLRDCGWTDIELKGIFQLDMKDPPTGEGEGGGSETKNTCPNCGHKF